MVFTTELFKLVNNPNYTYYKLFIDGVCQFDEFVEEVGKIPQDQRSLDKILALMDIFGYQPLPNTKFRHIIPKNKKERGDIFEFKNDKIRVYVILQKPNIYIVRGGWKKSQEKDIEKVKRETKLFNS